jgi:Rrf2 family transcriptional regulator, iron-sulfur cluster assembly transcription factor
MIYSKTAKYAVLALAEIARRAPGAYASTHAIADAASIPYPHFAKTLAQLKRAGLVITSRGKSGGILLAKPASEIRVLDVVLAIDGPGTLNDCPLFLAPCDCTRTCSLHTLWRKTHDAVLHYLTQTSIADIARARASLIS